MLIQVRAIAQNLSRRVPGGLEINLIVNGGLVDERQDAHLPANILRGPVLASRRKLAAGFVVILQSQSVLLQIILALRYNSKIPC
jgi:hypothetical protein